MINIFNLVKENYDLKIQIENLKSENLKKIPAFIELDTQSPRLLGLEKDKKTIKIFPTEATKKNAASILDNDFFIKFTNDFILLYSERLLNEEEPEYRHKIKAIKDFINVLSMFK